MSTSSGRLRELIRAVRGCKTAAEERALVQKECAAIRLAFRENRESSRSVNMLKLLYITMLGYPTEFGQMEVVKLLGQADYSGKRVGYLTLAVIMDETHEVLTLAENHIKRDLSNSNAFVQALALDVVANIAGEDMARDVLHEVEVLLDTNNLYLKKKAYLAALRIVRKAPDHAEIFLEKLQNIFQERQGGSLMCALTLLNECLRTEQGQEFLMKYRQQVTAAVRVLKQLILSSKVTDQDIGGVSDPFLQIRLLQFLRITGAGSTVASEAMNDVLAQVATNTDSYKNVGAAIHYECVKTINAIEADEGLRSLGVNTIGRFLTSTREHNLRFVALDTLLRMMSKDAAAVQRHSATIIDCLKDGDLSIRRRALELTVALVDDSNVRILVPDLLQYLHACTEESKLETVQLVASVIEQKAPTNEWRVEMSLRLFKIARQHVPAQFGSNFVALVSQQNKELRRVAVQGIWSDISGPFDATQQIRTSFLLAGVWLIGEYPNLIVNPQVTAEDIGATVAVIANSTTSGTLKQYALTALMKLASKYAASVPIAMSVFESNAMSLDCELQQRAVEYITMLNSFAEIAAFSYAEMPPMVAVQDEGKTTMPPMMISDSNVAAAVTTTAVKRQAIDDLFGDTPAAPSANDTTKAVVQQTNNNRVLLADDLFGPTPAATTTAAPRASHHHDVDALFGPSSPPAAAARTTPSFSAPAPSNHSSVDSLFGGPAPVVAAPPPASVPSKTIVSAADLFASTPAPAPAVFSAPPPPTVVSSSTAHDDIFGAPVAAAAPPSKRFEAARCPDFIMEMLATVVSSPPGTIDVETTIRGLRRDVISQLQFHVAVPRTCTVDVKPLSSSDIAPGGSSTQKFTVVSQDPSKARNLMLRVKVGYNVGLEKKEHLFQISQDL